MFVPFGGANERMLVGTVRVDAVTGECAPAADPVRMEPKRSDDLPRP